MNRSRISVLAALAVAGLVALAGCSTPIEGGAVSGAQTSSTPSAESTTDGAVEDSGDKESAEPTKDSGDKEAEVGSSSVDLSKTDILNTWIPGLDKPTTCDGDEGTMIGGGSAVVSCKSSASVDDQSAALTKVIEAEGGTIDITSLGSLASGSGKLSDGTEVNALITSSDSSSTGGGIVLTIGASE